MLGRVYKRGEIYHIAFSFKGTEFRKSANTKSKREAEGVLAHYLGLIARQEFKGFGGEKAYMLGEMLDDYRDDYEQRGLRDLRNVRYRCAHLRAFFGDVAVSAIDERQADLYIKH